MAFDPAADRSAVESALLDYLRAPGKYPLSAKQPALLFSSITEVLQLASGRAPASGPPGPAPSGPVQQAACFFLRSALLHPDASHYALLGLDSDAPAAAVKERYRLMMRLMHPDFSSARQQSDWPADAATRLNQAYQVLSSPAQRQAYDEQRRGVKPPAPKAAARPVRPRTPLKVSLPARRGGTDSRRWLKRLAAVFGIAGAIALLAVAFTVGSDGKDSLVQRPGIPPAAAPASKVAAAAPAKPAVAPAPAPVRPVTPPAKVPPAPSVAAPVPSVAAPAQPAPVGVVEALRMTPPAPVAAPSGARAVAPASAIVVTAPDPASPPLARAAIAQAILAGIAPITPPVPPASLAAATAKAPVAGLAMADVHPLLAKLLQRMESGWGDEVLGLLERDARSAPAAQALLLHYNGLVDGGRPVKLSQVRFEAQPSDGGLLVTGHVLIQARNAAVPKQLALQIEFASRGGTVVMTRLGRVQE